MLFSEYWMVDPMYAGYWASLTGNRDTLRGPWEGISDAL